MTFERITEIIGAYDRRDPNPHKNCGIHGMDMRFILRGSKGAVQFVFYSAQHLRHVADELLRSADPRFNPFHGIGVDIGYHSPKPMYPGQTGREDCPYLNGATCYYDGSSLRASEFEDAFIAGGSEAVWPMLEAEYKETFGDEE